MQLAGRNITKVYGKKKALDRVSFNIPEGICAFLGPNGAGKSTLVSIMAGILRPDGGAILFNGKNVGSKNSEFASLLGFMPQQETVYPEFTAEEYLAYIGILKGMKPAGIREASEGLLREVDLFSERKMKIRTMSGGMKQRLRLAQALMGEPRVVILDEPTAGLDPEQRRKVRRMLQKRAQGRIILFAPHVVPDIEGIADHVLILNHGRVAFCGRKSDLLTEQEETVSEKRSFLEEAYLRYIHRGEAPHDTV